jgi:hypothetical protein
VNHLVLAGADGRAKQSSRHRALLAIDALIRKPTMQLTDVLDHLHLIANPDNVAGMARFGINPHNTLGIDIYTLRKVAKRIGTDHALALQLWNSGIHEARILAVMDIGRASSGGLDRYFPSSGWRMFGEGDPRRVRVNPRLGVTYVAISHT